MKGKTTFSLWVFIIIALLLVLFSVQNAQEVGFQFLVWKTYLSLSILLIVAFLMGLIVGAVFSFRKNRRGVKIEKENTYPARGKDKTTKDQHINKEDQVLTDKK